MGLGTADIGLAPKFACVSALPKVHRRECEKAICDSSCRVFRVAYNEERRVCADEKRQKLLRVVQLWYMPVSNPWSSVGDGESA